MAALFGVIVFTNYIVLLYSFTRHFQSAVQENIHKNAHPTYILVNASQI